MPTIPLAQIQAARQRIAPFIRNTPLLAFDYLSHVSGQEILLKCENLQRTGSFKMRGASNFILENIERAKLNGVIAASAGNHAQGVAATCRHLGIASTIVMPVTTPYIKIQNTQSWGASIELVGSVLDEAYEHAKLISQTKGAVLVHPFKDPHIMAGQGTIGLELIEDPLMKEVEAVVISVGGGGMISGIAGALRALRPGIKIYGVTAANAPTMWRSFHAKQLVKSEVKFTLAEGVATKYADPMMLEYLLSSVDDVFSISEESIAHAISVLAEQGKLIVEGAGALPIAAVLEKMIPEKRLALVISGGNIDLPALSAVLQRGLVEQGRLVRLKIHSPDRPGGLASITETLAGRRANILQVFHQRATLQTGIGDVEIELDLETRGPEHTAEIIAALVQKGMRVQRVP